MEGVQENDQQPEHATIVHIGSIRFGDEEHDVFTALFKARVRNEIEEVKVAGEPTVVNVLPSNTEADALRWLRWDAAARDSILLYDQSSIYEKHVDDLTWSDALETGAFLYLLAKACFPCWRAA